MRKIIDNKYKVLCLYVSHYFTAKLFLKNDLFDKKKMSINFYSNYSRCFSNITKKKITKFTKSLILNTINTINIVYNSNIIVFIFIVDFIYKF